MNLDAAGKYGEIILKSLLATISNPLHQLIRNTLLFRKGSEKLCLVYRLRFPYLHKFDVSRLSRRFITRKLNAIRILEQSIMDEFILN